MNDEKKHDHNGNADNSDVNNNINNKENGKNKKHKGRGWLIALAVVVLLVGGAYLYWVISTKAPDIDKDKDTDTTEAEAVEVSGENRKEGVFTLLVVGDDQEGKNTDTMMVLRYDSLEHKANVVSIPRDSLVNIPDGVKKLNSVYHSPTNGGIEALMDSMEGVLGFRPDNYIVVDTGCFVDVIDAMGGVYFDVPQDMDYDDESDKDKDGVFEYIYHIHVKKGYQLLNGEDALGVFRFREGYAMGDIQRLGVQHDLLMSAAEQFMSSNLLELYKAASIIIKNSDTDLTYGNLQWYAQQFLKMSISDIAIKTMPTTGAFVKNTAYVTINRDEWFELLNSAINPLKDDITEKDCTIVYWANPTAPGADGQYHIDPNDLATTDGSQAYTNFVDPPSD